MGWNQARAIAVVLSEGERPSGLKTTSNAKRAKPAKKIGWI
jgi:hypothetical protein